MKENKGIISRIEKRGFRVEPLNGEYKVYKYSIEQQAYLFYGHYQNKKELRELLAY